MQPVVLGRDYHWISISSSGKHLHLRKFDFPSFPLVSPRGADTRRCEAIECRCLMIQRCMPRTRCCCCQVCQARQATENAHFCAVQKAFGAVLRRRVAMPKTSNAAAAERGTAASAGAKTGDVTTGTPACPLCLSTVDTDELTFIIQDKYGTKSSFKIVCRGCTKGEVRCQGCGATRTAGGQRLPLTKESLWPHCAKCNEFARSVASDLSDKAKAVQNHPPEFPEALGMTLHDQKAARAMTIYLNVCFVTQADVRTGRYRIAGPDGGEQCVIPSPQAIFDRYADPGELLRKCAHTRQMVIRNGGQPAHIPVKGSKVQKIQPMTSFFQPNGGRG